MELKTALLIPVILFFVLALVPNVFAASTATVSATVTVQNISVSVADGTVAYGTLTTSATSDTTSGDLNDSQTATNDGNITEDFNILGQNSTAWTLAATVDADQYAHSWCTSNCDSTPTWNNLTTSYQTLATGISASGNQAFDLQLETPSSTSSFTQQSVDVTVQAVAN